MPEMYFSSCKWPVGLQQIALEVSGETNLPTSRPTNADYLFKLKESLASWNVADSYVDNLVDAVVRRQAEFTELSGTR